MAREPGDGAIMEEIGGLLVHAEQAQAALDKGLAAQAENAETITRLIRDAAGIVKKLQAETAQISSRAEQAAARAVREEVPESLSEVGLVVGKAAGLAFAPVMKDAATRIDEARRAVTILDRQAERFANRMLVIVGSSALGALMLTGFGIWAALAWQRFELASLRQEKIDLRGEIAAMEAAAQKMRAEGLKIEFRNCAETNGRQRLCVAVQPSAQRWGTEQAPFYVLKGY